MNKLRHNLTAAAAWVRTRIDLADVFGFVGVSLAYDGARELFGPGWAKLGLGTLILVVYVALEALPLVRPTRGGSR